MARSAEVRPGQVWQDAAGRRLEVRGNPGSDGKYDCRNVDTGRGMRRGPRAFVNLVTDAPAAATGYAGPPGYAPGYGPPQPGYGHADVDLGDEDDDEGYEGVNPGQAYGPSQPFGFGPPQAAPPAPRGPARRPPPPRRNPAPMQAPAYQAPAPYPPPGYYGQVMELPPGPPAPARRGRGGSNPLVYPSELTRFLAEKLAAIPASRAGSPSVVSSEFARAMVEWKARGG